MDQSNRPRDMVFCHQCEDEWYRDEHGLECPRCHSDFTEIIEQGHDPRDEPPPPQQLRPNLLGSFPDPDEDDISEMRWQPQQGPTFRYVTPARQDSGDRPGPQSPDGSVIPPVLASFASMLGSILGGRPLPTGSDGQQVPQAPATTSQNSGGDRAQGEDQQGRLRSSPGPPGDGNTPDMAGNASGSSARMGGGTFVRMGGGPGFHWQITTSSGTSFHQDAHGPRAFAEVQDLRPLLSMMFGHPGGPMHGMQGDPFNHAGGPGSPGDAFRTMGPFGPVFAGIMNPAMMRSGDGVYSQEALDRIISQLMEQNASGNAPGPASREAISSLPEREITAKDLGTEGKAECSICMDEVNIGQKVTELPCHHWFHGDCIQAWLGEHDSCPHCRQGIMPKDGPQSADRARTPGEAPRHDQMWGQGDGSQSNPFVIPESPARPGTGRRQSGVAGPSRRSSNSNSNNNNNNNNNNNEGLFSRMRNAFGGGGSQ